MKAEHLTRVMGLLLNRPLVMDPNYFMVMMGALTTRLGIDSLEFDGFTSIVSEPPLYSDDLAYLEEWVIQGRERWEPMGTFSHTNRERM